MSKLGGRKSYHSFRNRKSYLLYKVKRVQKGQVEIINFSLSLWQRNNAEGLLSNSKQFVSF